MPGISMATEVANTIDRTVKGGPGEQDQSLEIALLREFQRGNREAFTQLYLRYRQRVYAYCLRMLGNPEEAEDMFQEVFIRIWQRAHQFAEDKSLSGWIFTIAHNLCLNRIRDRKDFERIEDHTDIA